MFDEREGARAKERERERARKREEKKNEEKKLNVQTKQLKIGMECIQETWSCNSTI